ncbi:class I SAM-dependent methyltransferase [Amycolatopsis sp. H20-H5]|uniref:class I SAM-dependent methyltransferase n=1 Tax=Amycolatopsis sp. H20-H5 TaxID=3046309 RepID=UPI002DBA1CFD|nr:class I SAM-dependent methyltransferase [Amycolatopsis sp. H20-H5]MEC3975182.1 class I SAM-dependent methyltransferase [Amycolatopsis sp. H20-H5]
MERTTEAAAESHRRWAGTANAEQAAVWDGPAGAHRVKHAEQDDAEVARHHELFRAATAIGTGDRVLDVGCGSGRSARDAARAAAPGEVLAVDLSARMLERARRLSDAEGLRNLAYEQVDAQVHAFPAARFDLAISRFGAMFFADPAAAFANIGRALRPAGRLVLLTWQSRERNEWASAVRTALVPGEGLPPLATGPNPFSLADEIAVTEVLGRAGFEVESFADVHEPVYYGRDADDACSVVLGLRSTNTLLTGMDAAGAERARERLRDMLRAHDTGEGVFFDSRAWIITAHRR